MRARAFSGRWINPVTTATPKEFDAEDAVSGAPTGRRGEVTLATCQTVGGQRWTARRSGQKWNRIYAR